MRYGEANEKNEHTLVFRIEIYDQTCHVRHIPENGDYGWKVWWN